MEFELIREIAVLILGVRPEIVTEEASFSEDLGADSLQIFEILTELGRRTGIDFSETDLRAMRTPGDMVRLLLAAEQEGVSPD